MYTLRKLWLCLSVLAISLLTISLVATHPAAAVLEGSKDAACAGLNLTESGTCDDNKVNAASTSVSHTLALVINILSIVAGVAAVITIVISGLRYITSQGDPNSVASAQRSIIYALVGLVIVALAQAIVRLVLDKVK